MILRPLTLADLTDVARLHQAAFTDSVMTWLGTATVRRYYDWLLTGPHSCVAVGVWQDGVLAGFCFGGRFKGAQSGFLRKNLAFLVAQVLMRPWLLLKPPVRQRLRGVGARFVTPQRRGRAPQPTSQISRAPVTPKTPSFGILSIAVSPIAKRGGVGTALMAKMEAEARRQGYSKMHLTVRVTNREATQFYERLHWIKKEQDGQWKGLMIRLLGEPG